MNESIYRVSLDLADTSSSAKIKSKRGDTSRALHITLATNGRPYVITEECTAVFTATKPSGRVIFNNCEIEDNVVVYQFTEQTCVEVGALPCEIRIYGADNKVITSARFTMYIEPTVYSEDVEIESEHEINALTELISEATTLIAEVERKLADGEFIGPAGPEGPAGRDGQDGEDYVLTEADKQEIADLIDVNVDGVVGGYYTPEVSQVNENTMRVSFTASGDKMPPVQSTEITLPAGRDGQDGKDGAAGQDGYTPQKGVDYFDGQDGQDGVSPTVAVSDITGGHRITITDANGEKTIDVMDGENGSDYVLTEADKQDIANLVDVQGSGVIAQPEQPTGTGVLWLDTDDNTNTELPTTLPNPYALTFTGAVEGTYDGSAPLSVEIPTGGVSEWKRLTRIEVAEDNVNYFHITTDENGEVFSAMDFTFRIKATKRASSVSSLKIMKPNYKGDLHLATSKVIGQLNAFGNTSGDRYYTFQLLHEGDWRKVFFSESNADIFSTTSDTWAVANDVYKSGVTYTVGSVEYPLNDIVIIAANNFFTGDIIEIWYK